MTALAKLLVFFVYDVCMGKLTICVAVKLRENRALGNPREVMLNNNFFRKTGCELHDYLRRSTSLTTGRHLTQCYLAD